MCTVNGYVDLAKLSYELQASVRAKVMMMIIMLLAYVVVVGVLVIAAEVSVSVSYTHLDVYKRQLVASGAPPSTG